MLKKPLIVGNWKMELSHKASVELAQSIRKLIHQVEVKSDVVVCPSYVSLPHVSEVFANTSTIGVGAQNVHWEEKGTWTGEVSVAQIRPFVKWCIVGHSEQRALSGETDEQVFLKMNLLITHGITPIVCIGETKKERDDGGAIEKIMRQTEILLLHMERSHLMRLVVAYEPIWAIGTGSMPDPDDVAEVLLSIRKAVTMKYDEDIADRLRILYGGSVAADNVAKYISGPGADGVLVGGASTHPKEFLDIVENIQKAWDGN